MGIYREPELSADDRKQLEEIARIAARIVSTQKAHLYLAGADNSARRRAAYPWRDHFRDFFNDLCRLGRLLGPVILTPYNAVAENGTFVAPHAFQRYPQVCKPLKWIRAEFANLLNCYDLGILNNAWDPIWKRDVAPQIYGMNFDDWIKGNKILLAKEYETQNSTVVTDLKSTDLRSVPFDLQTFPLFMLPLMEAHSSDIWDIATLLIESRGGAPEVKPEIVDGMELAIGELTIVLRNVPNISSIMQKPTESIPVAEMSRRRHLRDRFEVAGHKYPEFRMIVISTTDKHLENVLFGEDLEGFPHSLLNVRKTGITESYDQQSAINLAALYWKRSVAKQRPPSLNLLPSNDKILSLENDPELLQKTIERVKAKGYDIRPLRNKRNVLYSEEIGRSLRDVLSDAIMAQYSLDIHDDLKGDLFPGFREGVLIKDKRSLLRIAVIDDPKIKNPNLNASTGGFCDTLATLSSDALSEFKLDAGDCPVSKWVSHVFEFSECCQLTAGTFLISTPRKNVFKMCADFIDTQTTEEGQRSRSVVRLEVGTPMRMDTVMGIGRHQYSPGVTMKLSSTPDIRFLKPGERYKTLEFNEHPPMYSTWNPANVDWEKVKDFHERTVQILKAMEHFVERCHSGCLDDITANWLVKSVSTYDYKRIEGDVYVFQVPNGIEIEGYRFLSYHEAVLELIPKFVYYFSENWPNTLMTNFPKHRNIMIPPFSITKLIHDVEFEFRRVIATRPLGNDGQPKGYRPVKKTNKLKRGPKPKFDQGEDRKIFKGWNQYRREFPNATYADYGKGMGKSAREIETAIDRHRRRSY